MAICEAMSEVQQNECITSVYSLSASRVVLKCSEGCVGVVPDCVPHCINGCPPHSVCQRPNFCACNPGYIINETNPDVWPSLMSCKSACEPNCPDHSHCVAHNQCKCDKGFRANAVDPNAVPSLQSCKAQTTQLQLLVYALLGCCFLFITIAVISIIVKRIKVNKLAISTDASRSSW
ncbi:protein kinase C-binding protein NELL2-like [Drosophila hydei]|uniref:Protein kinase C-binding protein NELL2-like n=1 Tax=Drosophila hydei TaxID=7224 RepID=A0A6J2SXX9_DROHY|nr:protein kinase C-binding protein NELL2-like [Drosophila hydei]